MTSEEARIVRKRYAEIALEWTNEERNAIYDCYMQSIARDGQVWVTWTDVERLLVDLKECNR